MHKKQIIKVISIVAVIIVGIIGFQKLFLTKEVTVTLPSSKKDIEVPTKRNKQYIYKMGFVMQDILNYSDSEDIDFIIQHIIKSKKLDQEHIDKLKQVRDIICEELSTLDKKLQEITDNIPNSLNKLDKIGKYHVCNYKNSIYEDINSSWYPMDYTSTKVIRDAETLEQIGYVDLTYSRDNIQIRCTSSTSNTHVSNYNTDILFLREVGENYYEECLGYEQKEWNQFINSYPDFFKVQEEMIGLYDLINEQLDDIFPNGTTSVYAEEFLNNNKYNVLKGLEN